MRDEELPGRYLCGIECDGAAYHSSETARDRDRLRQQVLEARGWTIHRLWSTDWFKDRGGQIERLLTLIERTRATVREEQAAEQEAHARLAAIEQEEVLRAQDEKLSGAVPDAMAAYISPEAQPYVFADTPLRYYGQDFHAAPASFIGQAIEDVVKVEAPIHIKDLAARVVASWGHSQAGQAMQRRIRAIVEDGARQERLAMRGDFVFKAVADESIPVRSRAGTRILPERIAPEEYQTALMMVLRVGDGLDRKALTNSVRSLFGFSRTGTHLDSCINAVIDGLLAKEIVGEGSTGIKLRM